ncbi:MFS transporter small subunit [Mycobacterium sp. LTG2003]
MSEPAVEYHEYAPTVPKAYIALAWLWVVVPFGYGVYQLLLKVGQLFG